MDSPERNTDADVERQLDSLLQRCLSAVEQGRDAAVDVLCAEHPEHAPALRRRLAMLRDAGLTGEPGSDSVFPEHLGGFRLVRKLGGGGMGVVYLAEQTALGRMVALKLIRPENLYFPGARSRFAREAQAVARLSHPGIVRVHTVGEESGVPFIAMELVDGLALSDVLAEMRRHPASEPSGANLLEVLAKGRASNEPGSTPSAGAPFDSRWPDTCAWIGRELAQALEHAHQRGVVHRDIKPSNVMLSASGRALLVDFGLATASGAEQLTRTGSALGSLPYMAPEQVAGRHEEIGPATDVYALGVTLYELLTLRRPFHDSDDTRLRASILAARCPRLDALVPHVSRDLRSVIEVAMSPEPARRYRRAADLARDLSHVLAHEPIEARPANALERGRRWARRHPAQAIAVGLTALILIGGPTGFGIVQSRAAAKERELGRDLSKANSLAEQRNVELTGVNAELEVKRADLAQALSNESAERERAVQNFNDALEAVDTMLTRVGIEKLEDVPQMEGVRRELLEDALRFYERFVVQGAQDPSVTLRSAVTQRKVSLIREELGELVAARDAAEHSVDALRELEARGAELAELPQALCMALAQHSSTLMALQELERAEATQRELLQRLERMAEAPALAEYARHQTATSEQHLAFLLRDSGRVDEAIVHARRAAESLRARVDPSTNDVELLKRCGDAMLSLAIMEIGRSPARQSERDLTDAIAMLQRALDLAPENPRIAQALASAHGNLGLFLSRQELDQGFEPSGPNAESSLRAAVRINRELIGRFPLRALYKSGLVSGSSNLCVHLARSGRFADAREFAQIAVDATTGLVQLAPQSADHRSQLGAALSNLARLELHDGRAERALELLDGAREELRLAIEREPKNASFAGQLRQWHAARAQTLIALSRWAELLTQLAEFEAQNADRASQLWALEQRVECIRLAGAEPASESDGQARVERMRDEVVSRIRTLIEGGYDPARLASAKWLEPLRNHPGLSELLSD